MQRKILLIAPDIPSLPRLRTDAEVSTIQRNHDTRLLSGVVRSEDVTAAITEDDYQIIWLVSHGIEDGVHLTEEILGVDALIQYAKSESIEMYEVEWTEYVIFRLFTVLQQITCGFWNRRQDDGSYRTITFPHLRLDMLGDVISSIPAGEKVIVWAKYRRDIDAISTLLGQEYGPLSFARFYGDLSEKERNAELGCFRRDARFLVATPQSGGHGIDLTVAAYTVFYSNEFKYVNRLQAESRNDRLGQTKKVLYTDLVCRKSIDERIEQAMARKESAVISFKREVDRVKDKSRKEVGDLIRAL